MSRPSSIMIAVIKLWFFVASRLLSVVRNHVIVNQTQFCDAINKVHDNGLVEHFIRKFHFHFTYCKSRFDGTRVPSKLQVVIDTAALALFAVGSLKDQCRKVCGEIFNEVTLRRWACGLDCTSPKLSHNFTEDAFAFWSCLMGIV